MKVIKKMCLIEGLYRMKLIGEIPKSTASTPKENEVNNIEKQNKNLKQ